MGRFRQERQTASIFFLTHPREPSLSLFCVFAGFFFVCVPHISWYGSNHRKPIDAGTGTPNICEIFFVFLKQTRRGTHLRFFRRYSFDCRFLFWRVARILAGATSRIAYLTQMGRAGRKCADGFARRDEWPSHLTRAQTSSAPSAVLFCRPLLARLRVALRRIGGRPAPFFF